MATMRAMGRGPKGPVDEEFLRQLYRGGELLAQGKLEEARRNLERAHELLPRNEKARNLLGLAYFKMGHFDRAAEIYEALVRDNPVDATLRVNLGLVYLKTNALQRAMREFETATDLQPDHQKAHNYLGLALAQAGEYGRAREHFELAGSEVMVEKMARAIAGEGFRAPQPAPAPVEGTRPAPAEGAWGAQFGLDERPDEGASTPLEEEEELRFAEDEGPSALAEDEDEDEGPSSLAEDEGPSSLAEDEDEGSSALSEGEPLQPLEEDLAQLGDAQPDVAFAETTAAVAASAPLSEEEPTPSRGLSFRPGGEVPVLAELASAVVLSGASEVHPFRVGNGSFSVRVDGELFTRLEGLLAFSGQLQFQPEMRRSRGRPTDVPFGEGGGRMMRVSGQGVLFIEPGERSFLAVSLGDESAYLREECVFAFEEPVCFENGRVPSEVAPDLELVHLRGQGRVLLHLTGGLRSVAVGEGAPVTVPLAWLVGWQGKLIPRTVSLPEPGAEPSQVAVALEGEGFALISLPVR